jgi:glycosyltransferase involved in cell wall biosynthesis
MVTLSVVMAVRNGASHLREAIESVLRQSFSSYEFVIVDDASSDETPEILSEYQRLDSRIQVLRNPSRLGPYPSTNRGLHQARGRIIARHDGDDISPPDRLAVQLDALNHDPETVLVAGAVEAFNVEANIAEICRPPSWQPLLEWELLFRNALAAGAHVMFPRVIRGKPVLFQTRRRYAEDYELWCRLSRLGRVVSPDTVVYRYRLHGRSISSLHKGDQQQCAEEIRREYQAQYLRPAASAETDAELSRFWSFKGDRPLGRQAAGIGSTLAELRANFLEYTEERYGVESRAALEKEIDKSLSDRIGFWLSRSLRFRDARACRDLLAITAERNLLNVWATTLGYCAATLRRRLSRTSPKTREKHDRRLAADTTASAEIRATARASPS